MNGYFLHPRSSVDGDTLGPSAHVVPSFTAMQWMPSDTSHGVFLTEQLDPAVDLSVPGRMRLLIDERPVETT